MLSTPADFIGFRHKRITKHIFCFDTKAWNSYDAPLMQHRLPDRVNPFIFADKGRQFNAPVAVADLSRLAGRLRDTGGSIQVDMLFDRDPAGIRRVSGQLRGSLQLSCERCLEAFEFPLAVDFSLALLESEGMIERMPEQYEPLLVTGQELRPLDVVEDEILLALPMFPVHKKACSPPGVGAEHEQDNPANRSDAARENPFALLAKLKQRD